MPKTLYKGSVAVHWGLGHLKDYNKSKTPFSMVSPATEMILHAKLHIDFRSCKTDSKLLCAESIFPTVLKSWTGSLHKKQKASHYFQIIWQLIVKCYAPNICIPLLLSQVLLKIIMFVFHSWQNMQITNYTAKIPEWKRYFFYVLLLTGSRCVTLFCHYAISSHVLLMSSYNNPLPHACLLALFSVEFFPWWVFRELQNQHLNGITWFTGFCFALTLQSGLKADKEVQGPCLRSQDHRRYENNVAISSAYMLLPHLHCLWDFFLRGEVGMGCLAVLPMDARLQLLNSRHLGEGTCL